MSFSKEDKELALWMGVTALTQEMGRSQENLKVFEEHGMQDGIKTAKGNIAEYKRNIAALKAMAKEMEL